MKTGHPIYHGKTLLFGEYTIIVGSEALVVPLRRFSAYWMQADPKNQTHVRLQSDLKQYILHIESNKDLHQLLDYKALIHAFDEAWFVYSDIPQGYGAGSSGALVANLFSRFGYRSETEDLEALRLKLSKLEAYFHGNSSGLDPLACYLGKPLYVSSGEIRETSVSNLPELEIYLLDTGLQSPTAPLVGYFKEQLLKYSFYKKLNTKLLPFVQSGINALLQHDALQLKTAMAGISAFQYEHFTPMIPEHMLQYWKNGLDRGEYLFKLCGSGGGGFMLVFSFAEATNAESIFGLPAFRIL